MRKVNLDNVQEAGDFRRPTAGAYICVITDVVDIPEKEYLKVSYDHADGEFKGYYAELRKKFPDWDWCGAYCKSYKQAALPMFKRFCNAVSRSNGNFVFDANNENAEEKTLIGKKVGLVFQKEEYYGNDGSIKDRLIVAREFPIDKLDSQKVPEPKTVNRVDSNEFKPVEVEVGIDEELPFA